MGTASWAVMPGVVGPSANSSGHASSKSASCDIVHCCFFCCFLIISAWYAVKLRTRIAFTIFMLKLSFEFI